jgi:hypothetical protein
MNERNRMSENELIDTGSQNIPGYSKQTPGARDLVESVKFWEAKFGHFIADYLNAGEPLDPRQVALARTNFEDGFMHLVRGVFQPEDPIGDAIAAWQTARSTPRQS